MEATTNMEEVEKGVSNVEKWIKNSILILFVHKYKSESSINKRYSFRTERRQAYST